jgi:hypothetical protein
MKVLPSRWESGRLTESDVGQADAKRLSGGHLGDLIRIDQKVADGNSQSVGQVVEALVEQSAPAMLHIDEDVACHP